VLLAARWTWQPAEAGTVKEHHFRRERPSATAPTEVARNLSHLVQALAVEIAASLPAAPERDETAP
jgi:hypothetical protein